MAIPPFYEHCTTIFDSSKGLIRNAKITNYKLGRFSLRCFTSKYSCHCEPVRHSDALRAAAKRRLRSARACGRSGVAIRIPLLLREGERIATALTGLAMTY